MFTGGGEGDRGMEQAWNEVKEVNEEILIKIRKHLSSLKVTMAVRLCGRMSLDTVSLSGARTW